MREGKVPNMEVTAICDIDPSRLALAEERFPEVARFDNAFRASSLPTQEDREASSL